MGRAKVRMERINHDKNRKSTFHKRKDGLLKKAFELTELCDVNVSMIICIDNQPPQSFPEDPCKFKGMIDVYKGHQHTNPGKIRHYSLSDFLNDRKIKIEEELAKAKEKNREAKYPTWFDFLNNYSEVQLRQFAFGLGRKIDLVKTKIESLKHRNIQNLGHHVFYPRTFLDHGQSSFVTPSINPNPMPMMNPNDLVFFPGELLDDRNKYIMKTGNPGLSFKPQSPVMIATNYNDHNFDRSQVFANHNMIQLKNPHFEKSTLLTRENDNDDFYDYVNSGLQPQSPVIIPMNNNHLVADTSQLYAESNNLNSQSENPDLDLLKLPTTSGNDDWFDYEEFGIRPDSPTFWLSPETPELPPPPPFMQMSPVSNSESSFQMTEYNGVANGSD